MRCVLSGYLIAAVSCNFPPLPKLPEPEGGDMSPGGSDAAVDGAQSAGNDVPVCVGASPFSICLARAPRDPLRPAGPLVIDTSTSPMCAEVTSGGDNCVVAATVIELSSSLTAVGTRPLVLLALDSMTLLSQIDVGSHQGIPVRIGAGADSTECMSAAVPQHLAGGAGGSFVGIGGRGGISNADGSVGGAAGATVTGVTRLRGGCPGQSGDGPQPGSGGHGGGAALVIAGKAVVFGPLASINASGTGGGGGGSVGGGELSLGSGGGGGGSGGMIVIDAPLVMAAPTTTLIANGGGGGEGSDASAGSAGADPSQLAAALGGGGSSGAGDGGSGSAGSAAGPGRPGRTSGALFGGGGGGGGGAGLIKLPATADVEIQSSPAVTL